MPEITKKSKGDGAKLAYLGHSVIEDRNGLTVKAKVTHADGRAELEAATYLLAELPGEHRKTIGADKNYDTKDFVASCRGTNITPHVARKGASAIDTHTSWHEG